MGDGELAGLDGRGVVKDGVAGASLRMVDSVVRNMATSSFVTPALIASRWKTPTSFVKPPGPRFIKPSAQLTECVTYAN